jgi:hypothetical protein
MVDLSPPLTDLGWCPIGLSTGKPCPLCGGTRAVLALARADLNGALQFNAFVVATIGFTSLIFCIYWLRAVFSKVPQRNAPRDVWRRLQAFVVSARFRVIGVLVLSWVWNFGRW